MYIPDCIKRPQAQTGQQEMAQKDALIRQYENVLRYLNRNPSTNTQLAIGTAQLLENVKNEKLQMQNRRIQTLNSLQPTEGN